MDQCTQHNIDSNNSKTELVSLYRAMNNEIIIGKPGVAPNRLIHENIPIQSAQDWIEFYEETGL